LLEFPQTAKDFCSNFSQLFRKGKSFQATFYSNIFSHTDHDDFSGMTSNAIFSNQITSGATFVHIFRKFAPILWDFVNTFNDFAPIFTDFVPIFGDPVRICDK